jgi:hypothetical protein
MFLQHSYEHMYGQNHQGFAAGAFYPQVVHGEHYNTVSGGQHFVPATLMHHTGGMHQHPHLGMPPSIPPNTQSGMQLNTQPGILPNTQPSMQLNTQPDGLNRHPFETKLASGLPIGADA